ncbi:MAG: LysM domain-containing protein, partial [Patescibacteria group bacterium]
MKKLFIVLAIVLAMASVVNAGAYTVRKGDCLSIIAQKHGVSCQALLKANKDKIKNVDLIFQKQILRIPEKVKVVVASATAETFLWKKAGANSFGKRNFFKA